MTVARHDEARVLDGACAPAGGATSHETSQTIDASERASQSEERIGADGSTTGAIAHTDRVPRLHARARVSRDASRVGTRARARGGLVTWPETGHSRQRGERTVAVTTDVTNALANALAAEKALAGFRWVRAAKELTRDLPGRTQSLGIDASKHGGRACLVTLRCGIRHDPVEALLARYLSGRRHAEAHTIGAHGMNFGKPWCPVRYAGASHWLVGSAADVDRIYPQVQTAVAKGIVPFFRRFGDVGAVGKQLAAHDDFAYPVVLAICVLRQDAIGAARFLEKLGPMSRAWVAPHRPQMLGLVRRMHVDHPDVIPLLEA